MAGDVYDRPLCVLIDQDVQPRELFAGTLDRPIELEVVGDLDEDGLIEALEGIDVLVTISRLSVTYRVLSARPGEVRVSPPGE
jgi:hypothetical protein